MEKNNQTNSMKFINGLRALAIIFCLFQSFENYAGNYFTSSGTAAGNFSAGNSWSTGCGVVSPVGGGWPSTTSDNATICGSKIITTSAANQIIGALTINSGGRLVIAANLSVTSLTILSGGTITINSNSTLTVTGDMNVAAGATVTNNGKVILSGNAQTITCAQPFYDLQIAGIGNKTMATDITVNNDLILIGGFLVVGNKTLTVGTNAAGNTGQVVSGSGKITLSTTAGSYSSLNFGGDQNNLSDLGSVLSNTWPVTVNNFTLSKTNADVGLGTNRNLSVAGAFSLTGGNFTIGSNTLTLNGAISSATFGSLIGGTNSNLTIGGTGAASMYFNINNTGLGGSNTINNFTNTRTSHSFVMLSSLRIDGVLSTGALSSLTISTGSSQTLTIDGTVSGTARLIGNANATLNILGSGSMGGTLSFASTPTLSSLTMNRISSGTATLGSDVSVGSLALSNGVLTSGFVTTVTGTATSAVTNSNSSAYLAGALARTIAANTSSTAYQWPIGKAAPQKLTFNGISTGAGTVVIKAEAFDGNSNGSIDATLESRRTDNYWSASVTSNPANLVTVGTITLADASPAIASTVVVAHASSVSGVYTSLGVGSPSSSSVTSAFESPKSLGFYNLAEGGNTCTNADVPTVTASSMQNCGALSTTLSIASGALNSATAWKWYSGSCGTNPVGTGSSIDVLPSITTTYFVRGEGGCTTPGACASVTITVSPPTVGGSISGETGACLGTPSSQLTLSGYTGSIMRWESSVSPFTAWSTINNTSTTYTSENLFEDTRFRAIVKSGTCPETASSSLTVLVNRVTFGAASTQIVCPNTEATVAMTGLVPGSISNVTYIKNPGGIQSSLEVIANEFGSGTFQILITGAGQSIIIESITRTDSNPDCALFPASGNTVIFPVASGCTAVQASQCGTVTSNIDSYVYANLASQAQGYRWRVTTLTGTPSNEIQFGNTALRNLRLTQLPHYAFNTTYKVEVSVRRNDVWGPFGMSCNVTTPAPATQLVSCNTTITNMNNVIYANLVSFAQGYRFRITDPDNPQNTQTLYRALRDFRMNLITDFAVLYNKTYNVEVSVKNTNYGPNTSEDGVYLPFVSLCTVSTPAFQTSGKFAKSEFQANAYPNPFNDSFQLEITSSSAEAVSVKIYDMTGRLIESQEGGIDNVKSLEIGRGLPSGIYNVILSQGDDVKSLRVIRR
jgi:hypothetical protein